MITSNTFEADPLDVVIERTLARLDNPDLPSKEYTALLEQLVKLYALKETDKPKRMSRDTMLLVAGNLLGIVMIISYERVNVIATRAIGFVQKLR